MLYVVEKVSSHTLHIKRRTLTWPNGRCLERLHGRPYLSLLTQRIIEFLDRCSVRCESKPYAQSRIVQS